MTWLFPSIVLHREEDTLYKQEKLFVTNLDFNTCLVLQNWPDRFILTIRVFGFGFRKVYIYE